MNGGCELGEGFEQEWPRACDVHSHVACGFFSEHFSVVQCKGGFVCEQTYELVVAQSKSSAVKPHKERCLRTERQDLRDVFSTEFFNRENIAL